MLPVYLVSHPGALHEILDPHFLDLSGIYESDFVGMPHEPISFATFEAVREGPLKDIGAYPLAPRNSGYSIATLW